jgi:hypothetical protein
MKLLNLTLTLLFASFLFTAGVVKGQCEPEFNELDSCTADVDEDNKCSFCVHNTPNILWIPTIHNCDDLQKFYCHAVESCSHYSNCGACIGQMEPVVGCLLNNQYSNLGGCNFTRCPIDGNDFEEECEPELNALDVCTGYGTDIEDSAAVSCHFCVNQAPDVYVQWVWSCNDLQATYCAAVDLCDSAYVCGACIGQMEPAVGCLLNNKYSTFYEGLYGSYGGAGDCNPFSCDPGDDPQPNDDPNAPPEDDDPYPYWDDDLCVGSAGLCINGLLDCCSGLSCENSICAVTGSGGTSIGFGSFATYICLLGLALLWM